MIGSGDFAGASKLGLRDPREEYDELSRTLDGPNVVYLTDAQVADMRRRRDQLRRDLEP